MVGRRNIESGGQALSDSKGSMKPELGSSGARGISATVSQLVSQTLGLEVFEYRPGSKGIGGLTKGELEVGTYVTDNLFVTFVESMEEEQTGQKVILEYQFFPWLRLRGTRQTEGESGFDLLFQWQWR
jgi:autotransporter translocation and assembly factor TamB